MRKTRQPRRARALSERQSDRGCSDSGTWRPGRIARVRQGPCLVRLSARDRLNWLIRFQFFGTRLCSPDTRCEQKRAARLRNGGCRNLAYAAGGSAGLDCPKTRHPRGSVVTAPITVSVRPIASRCSVDNFPATNNPIPAPSMPRVIAIRTMSDMFSCFSIATGILH